MLWFLYPCKYKTKYCRSNVQPENTIPAAEAAQNDDIEIYVAAVGAAPASDFDMAEINGMASDPDSDHVFQVYSTADIDAVAGQILDKLCQGS